MRHSQKEPSEAVSRLWWRQWDCGMVVKTDIQSSIKTSGEKTNIPNPKS